MREKRVFFVRMSANRNNNQFLDLYPPALKKKFKTL